MRMQWLLIASLVAGPAAVGPAVAAEDEPETVVVQHVLIGFKKTLARKGVTRTRAEAEALAAEVLRRAREGEPFDGLVREYTDDSYPGVYRMTNDGAPLRADAYKRRDMAPAFGDVAFGLEVGEIGLAEFGRSRSPYGWHVIVRLE